MGTACFSPKTHYNQRDRKTGSFRFVQKVVECQDSSYKGGRFILSRSIWKNGGTYETDEKEKDRSEIDEDTV